jgi:hypothetical protein
LSGASPSQLASTFGSGLFLLLVRLNLGFVLRETCRCAHHTFLAKHRQSSIFLALLPGKRGFLQGESLASNLLLCYCFAYFLYFIFACIFLSKIQKISSFIVVIFACMLLVLLEWVLLRTPSYVTLLAQTTVILSALLLRHLLLR